MRGALGEKWIDGGVLQWRGIGGGIREVVCHGQEIFRVQATLARGGTYRIDLELKHFSGTDTRGGGLRWT